MISKIQKPILVSIIQIIVLAIIHDSLNHFYPMQHKSVRFGLTIFCTEIIFILSIFIWNFYLEFSKKNIYIFGLSLLILACIFPLETFNERPLRSILLILLALSGFLSSLILSKLRTKNN